MSMGWEDENGTFGHVSDESRLQAAKNGECGSYCGTIKLSKETTDIGTVITIVLLVAFIVCVLVSK